MISPREHRLLSLLLAGFAAACSACATAPVSVADRQAASDAEVDLAVCVTEGDKPNLFFNPLPKMLADQVESRYRPPKKPSFNKLTRLPYGGDAGSSGCEVVISMRADGQAIWNLRHAILTNAATKEELLHTSSQQACGPCFAGMMDGLMLPIIKALDRKGPLHAKIRGGGSPAVASGFVPPARPKGGMMAAPAAPAGGMMFGAARPTGAMVAAEPAAETAVEPAPTAEAPAPAAPQTVARKMLPLSDFSEAELAELDYQIFP